MENESMEFILPSSGILKISSKVLDQLKEFCQIKELDCESGGLLIGRFILSSNNVVIDELTTPFKRDKRGRYFFKKIDKKHQRTLDKNWEVSEGTSNYIGEWHTHPEMDPKPSAIDIKEWKRKAIEDHYDNDFLIYIIVGIEAINAWLISKVDGQIHSLNKK